MTTTRSSNHTNGQARSRRVLARGLCLALSLSAVGAALSGCRGDRSDKPPRRFFPDMDYQPKIKPQSETPFYTDGKSQRPLVEGTIAFGSTTHDPVLLASQSWGADFQLEREAILGSNRVFSTGLVDGSDTEYVAMMPVELTRELIERGQERFNIYCSACHGYDGVGGDSGTVGRLWSIPPANLSQDVSFQDRNGERGSDGYLFHIIREGLYTADGLIRMPSYKHAVDEQDAWAIVAYMRVLQAAHSGDPASIDASVRSSLGAPPVPQTETESATDSSNGGEG